MTSSSIYPIQFPGTKKGYRDYLLAMGVNDYDGTNTPAFCISLESFKAIDRRDANQIVSDKITRLSNAIDNIYTDYIKAIENGNNILAELLDNEWSVRSRQYINARKELNQRKA